MSISSSPDYPQIRRCGNGSASISRPNRRLLSNSIFTYQLSLTKMSSLPFTSVLKATLVLPSTNQHRLMFVGIHNRSCSDMRRRIFTCREGDSRQIIPTKSFAGEFISVYAVFDFCKVGRSIAVDCHPTSVGFAAACGSINW